MVMKIFLTTIGCIGGFFANAQQEKLNKFVLVDATTNKPLTVSVAISRAQLSITTENDGIFIIPGDLKLMSDTVIFSVQNYEQLRMPLKALNGLDTLRLSKSTLHKSGIASTFSKDTVLNDFENRDVVHFAGLHDNGERFGYLQLAQQFEINTLNARLDAIQIDRLSFSINSRHDIAGGSQDNNDIEYTKFKIRVYDMDLATGKPGKDLCAEVIEINISDSEKALINLKKHNIIIPNKTFFIAIEWMRDYGNVHYTAIFDDKGNNENLIGYKPAIGISPITNKRLNIWALDASHKWVPYKTFSPFGTDLAIKATVVFN